MTRRSVVVGSGHARFQTLPRESNHFAQKGVVTLSSLTERACDLQLASLDRQPLCNYFAELAGRASLAGRLKLNSFRILSSTDRPRPPACESMKATSVVRDRRGQRVRGGEAAEMRVHRVTARS